MANPGFTLRSVLSAEVGVNMELLGTSSGSLRLTYDVTSLQWRLQLYDHLVASCCTKQQPAHSGGKRRRSLPPPPGDLPSAVKQLWRSLAHALNSGLIAVDGVRAAACHAPPPTSSALALEAANGVTTSPTRFPIPAGGTLSSSSAPDTIPLPPQPLHIAVAFDVVFLHVPGDTEVDLNSDAGYRDLKLLLHAWHTDVGAGMDAAPQPFDEGGMDVDMSKIQKGGNARDAAIGYGSVREVLDSFEPRYIAPSSLPPCVAKLQHDRMATPSGAALPFKEYQLQAVAFMLEREVGGAGLLHTPPAQQSISATSHLGAHVGVDGPSALDLSYEYYLHHCNDTTAATRQLHQQQQQQRTPLRAHAHPLWSRIQPSFLYPAPCACTFFANYETGVVVREGCTPCQSEALTHAASPTSSATGNATAASCGYTSSGTGVSVVEASPPAAVVAAHGVAGHERSSGGVVGEEDVLVCDGNVRGGLLCDEPGLGKTAECIGLIVAHPHESPALPPHALAELPTRMASWTTHQLREMARALATNGAPSASDSSAVSTGFSSSSASGGGSGGDASLSHTPSGKGVSLTAPGTRFASRATLVVVPGSLRSQWIQEVKKWAPALQVYTYEGCAALLRESHGISTDFFRRNPGLRDADIPRAAVDAASRAFSSAIIHLSLSDIVLVSYEALAADNKYGDSVRSSARYAMLPSPLLRLRFHRAILDEAQFIESGSSQASLKACSARTQMAVNLAARYRWCVSGTPLDTPEDVRSALAFLKHQPFGSPLWWKRVLRPALAEAVEQDESDGGDEPEQPAKRQSVGVGVGEGSNATTSSALRVGAASVVSGMGGSLISMASPTGKPTTSRSSTATPSQAGGSGNSCVALLGSGLLLLRKLLEPIIWRSTRARLESRGLVTLPPVFHFVLGARFGPVEHEYYAELARKAADNLLPRLHAANGLSHESGSGACAGAGVVTSSTQHAASVTEREREREGSHRAELLALCAAALRRLQQICVHSKVVLSSGKGGAAIAAAAGGVSKTASTLSGLMLGLTTQAAIQEEEACREVYKLTIQLAETLEHAANTASEYPARAAALWAECAKGTARFADTEHAHGSSLHDKLAARAASWYGFGWSLSAKVVVWRAEWADEVVALRAWKKYDVACLSGLRRVLLLLGDVEGADAIITTLRKQVIEPFISSKLRLQLRFSLSQAYTVAQRLLQPTSAWVDDPRAEMPAWLNLYNEFATRHATIAYPPTAAAGKGASGGAVVVALDDDGDEMLEVQWNDAYLERAEEVAVLQRYGSSSNSSSDREKSSGHSAGAGVGANSSAGTTGGGGAVEYKLATEWLRVHSDSSPTDFGFLARVRSCVAELNALQAAVYQLSLVRHFESVEAMLERLHKGVHPVTREESTVFETRVRVGEHLRAILHPGQATIDESASASSATAGSTNASSSPSVGAAQAGASGVGSRAALFAAARAKFSSTVSALQRPELHLRRMLQPGARSGGGEVFDLAYWRRFADISRRQLRSLRHVDALARAQWLHAGYGHPDTWAGQVCLSIHHDVSNLHLSLENVSEFARMVGEVESREAEILAALREFEECAVAPLYSNVPTPTSPHHTANGVANGITASSSGAGVSAGVAGTTFHGAEGAALATHLRAISQAEEVLKSQARRHARWKAVGVWAEKMERRPPAAAQANITSCSTQDTDVVMVGASSKLAAEAHTGSNGGGEGTSAATSALLAASTAAGPPPALASCESAATAPVSTKRVSWGTLPAGTSPGLNALPAATTATAAASSSASPGDAVTSQSGSSSEAGGAGVGEAATIATACNGVAPQGNTVNSTALSAVGEGTGTPIAVSAGHSGGVPTGSASSGANNVTLVAVDDYTCPICKGELVGPSILPCCSHTYCKECISWWLLKSGYESKCPMCRSVVSIADLYYVDTQVCGKELHVQLLDSYDPSAAAPTARAMAAAALKHLDPAVLSHFTPLETVNACALRNEYDSAGTKLAVLLRRVLTLPPDDKCLIVSRWPAMLDVVRVALTAHQTRCVVLTGPPSQKSDVVRAFTDTPGIRALLLNSTTDCSGLTLTAANHLFVVEPQDSGNIAIQLAGRICRLGQPKPCVVYHCVIEGTVEEFLVRHVMCPALLAGDTAAPNSKGPATRASRHASSGLVTLAEYQSMFALAAPTEDTVHAEVEHSSATAGTTTGRNASSATAF